MRPGMMRAKLECEIAVFESILESVGVIYDIHPASAMPRDYILQLSQHCTYLRSLVERSISERRKGNQRQVNLHEPFSILPDFPCSSRLDLGSLAWSECRFSRKRKLSTGRHKAPA